MSFFLFKNTILVPLHRFNVDFSWFFYLLRSLNQEKFIRINEKLNTGLSSSIWQLTNLTNLKPYLPKFFQF